MSLLCSTPWEDDLCGLEHWSPLELWLTIAFCQWQVWAGGLRSGAERGQGSIPPSWCSFPARWQFNSGRAPLPMLRLLLGGPFPTVLDLTNSSKTALSIAFFCQAKRGFTLLGLRGHHHFYRVAESFPSAPQRVLGPANLTSIPTIPFYFLLIQISQNFAITWDTSAISSPDLEKILYRPCWA